MRLRFPIFPIAAAFGSMRPRVPEKRLTLILYLCHVYHVQTKYEAHCTVKGKLTLSVCATASVTHITCTTWLGDNVPTSQCSTRPQRSMASQRCSPYHKPNLLLDRIAHGLVVRYLSSFPSLRQCDASTRCANLSLPVALT